MNDINYIDNIEEPLWVMSQNTRSLVAFKHTSPNGVNYGLLICNERNPKNSLTLKINILSDWGWVNYTVFDIHEHEKDEVYDLYIQDFQNQNYWWETL